MLNDSQFPKWMFSLKDFFNLKKSWLKVMFMPAWLIFDPFLIRPQNGHPFCQSDVCCLKQSHNSIFFKLSFKKKKKFFSRQHKEAIPQNFSSLFLLGCRKIFFGEPVFSVQQEKENMLKRDYHSLSN